MTGTLRFAVAGTAGTALHTEELLCLSPDVGQPGTEIFNMPAITGAGNFPIFQYQTSFPAGLLATESRRLGGFETLFNISPSVTVAGRAKAWDTP